MSRQHFAVEFFEFFCCGRLFAELFLEPEGCQQQQVGEDDGVSFPSADLHFVLEAGVFERGEAEFSHTGVAVGVGAFLRDVGSVFVEEVEQLFARRDFGERGKSVGEPPRQV